MNFLELRAALAQQGERKNCPQPEICGSKECEFCRDTAAPAQQPVAYITDTAKGHTMTTLQEALPCPFCGSTHVGHTKLDYREFVICNRCGAGADSVDTAPEKTALEVWNTRAALAQQGEPVCADCGIPAGDVHMSTCKSGKWPSRVSNGDTAAPAPVAQQGEQAKPAAYITDTWQGPMVWTPEMYDEACTYCDDGEFPVPLYTAAPAPQAQPMTDPCKTCSHFKEGNLPGVRIHDETCYECRSYWGNKWEAA